MNDLENLKKLLKGNHSCISIVTTEESLARQLVFDVAMDLKRNLNVWSITEGLREATLSGSSPHAETDHPAAFGNHGRKSSRTAKLGKKQVRTRRVEHSCLIFTIR